MPKAISVSTTAAPSRRSLPSACGEFVTLERRVCDALESDAAKESTFLDFYETLKPLRDRQEELGEEIAGTPATTLAGMRAKALALVAWAPDLMDGEGGPDRALLASLLRDLTAGGAV